MEKISFSKESFIEMKQWPLDLLESEVSKYSIRAKLFIETGTTTGDATFRNSLDRLTVMKAISQLRRGKLTPEEFDMKVTLY